VRPDRSQRQLIRAVVAGGAAALAATWATTQPSLDKTTLVRAAVLTGITAIAEFISIRLPHGATSEQITLGEIAIAADVALLPAAISPLVAIAGLTITLLVRRRQFIKIAYNAGQYALATVAAAMCFHGIGHGEFSSARGLAALFLGMSAFAGSNLLTISAIISTISGSRLANVVREEYRLSLAVAIGNSSVGMVAVALWFDRPILVPAVLGPAIALHLAYRGWVRQLQFVREIEDQKAKLERIVAHSSEGIVLADAEGTVVLWSPSMERITGVASTEAEGKSVGYLLRGRDADGSSVQVEVGGSDQQLEVTRADGEERWLRVRHGTAHDENMVRWDVIVVHDVTTEHATEKMKQHFLSVVSHELRTPLTPIIGYAKFLLRRDDVDPQIRRDALASLLERSEHMQRLVEDLLLASTIDDSGGMRVHARREPVDLTEIVSRGVSSMRVSHPQRQFVFDGSAPMLVLGDQVRIRQVLANLLDNAVKFSPAETPVVVKIEREDDRAILSITDRGRGIPADRQEDIFGKFRRLEDPDRMETGGAGLGLFIVDQLVRAMGGTITVDSAPGRGSTFSVGLEAIAGQATDQTTAIGRSA
jgi:PAS domain S-box-containing protein